MEVNVYEVQDVIDEEIVDNVIETTTDISVEDVEITEIKTSKGITYLSDVLRRIVDICAGLVGLLILIPLTIGVYIINKINHENGPLFFVQERIGKNGKTFKMLKYRSMVVGAEDKLKEYLKENKDAAKEYKKYKKLQNDPRITKIGRVLRKTSLDEMPQLLHLITGTMSLVGPRPYLPGEKEDMGEYYDIIIQSKPGITGLWQVSGRSNTTFEDRLFIDLEYHNNKSLKQDFKILYLTFKHVIKKEGAI